MAGRGRTSFQKRQKERSRQEKQREKAEKRQQRKLEKQTQEPGDNIDWSERPGGMAVIDDIEGPETAEGE